MASIVLGRNVQTPPRELMLRVQRASPSIWQAFYQAVTLAQNRLRIWGGTAVVTSWWRSPEANAAVGGDAQSQHLLGLALDLTGSDLPLIADAFKQAGFGVEIHNAGSGEHVHAQAWPPGVARRAGLL